MRTLLLGEGAGQRLLSLVDPDAPSETEFEFTAGKILAQAYPAFTCFVFTGGFKMDDRVYKPDLAIVAKDFSHWFIVEVELVTHSFERHVLPQVRAFRFGDPQSGCESILSRELSIDRARAQTLLHYVPKSVAVVVNRDEPRWRDALLVNGIQMLVVSSYRAPTGETAIQLDGSLSITSLNLGFGVYSATDRSIRFPPTVGLLDGPLQIEDERGGSALWTVSRASGAAWATKDTGVPDIEDTEHVQLVRAYDGRVLLRHPRLPIS